MNDLKFTYSFHPLYNVNLLKIVEDSSDVP